jgi:hypothetical protein
MSKLVSLLFAPGLFLATLSLAVAAPPSINFQPKDQTVVLYQQAALGVIASGTAPLSYQWRKDGAPRSRSDQ